MLFYSLESNNAGQIQLLGPPFGSVFNGCNSATWTQHHPRVGLFIWGTVSTITQNDDKTIIASTSADRGVLVGNDCRCRMNGLWDFHACPPLRGLTILLSLVLVGLR